MGALGVLLFLALTFGGGKTDMFFGTSSLLVIGIGILYLRNVYFETTPDKLILKSLIGSAQTVYTFNSLKDFSIEKGTIVLAKDGKHVKLPLYSWAADKKDWGDFIQWLG